MKFLRSALLLVLVSALLLVTACGNKGDLVRPEPKASASAGS